MKKKFIEEVMDWTKTIGISLTIAIGVSTIIKPTIVSGQSMYPTLKDQDYLIINKLAYSNRAPSRGEIIVFRTNLIDEETMSKKHLVKRVIALPGEHIVIKNNKVYINGQLLEENYLQDIHTYGDIDMVVPKNHVFTMGDNRENSDDSRNSCIGAISLDDIVGEVTLRAFPLSNMGIVK
ncbi:signal peptidase I [Terrisporobacter sp.]|uniref:signal peptidase I n=1 Tax=Terrisporobacter sp. TaxID=1965305 RepID=UPI0026154A38|nr:signal peptidase I [Terrisporobacter sp.]